MLRCLLALFVPLAVFAGAPALTFEDLGDFPNRNDLPTVPLLENRDGRIYELFGRPGTNSSGLARVTNAGKLSVLHRFNAGVGLEPTGFVTGEDAIIYGSCARGGEQDTGTLWYFDPLAKTFGKLQDFFLGESPVLQCRGPGNTLYGTYPEGIFQSTVQGQATHLATFPITGTGSANIVGPRGLIVADGVLYGTSAEGGPFTETFPQGYGVLFKVRADGVVETIANFDSTTGPAPERIAAVTDEAGEVESFYGVTTRFDAITNAVIESVLLQILPTGEVTVRHHFGAGTGRTDLQPEILLGGDGQIYAVIPGNPDQIIRYDPAKTLVTPLYTFTSAINGAGANLVLTRAGTILGAAKFAASPKASLFRLTGDSLPESNLSPYARNDRRPLPIAPTAPAVVTPTALFPLGNDGDADVGDTVLVDSAFIENAAANSGTVAVSEDGKSILYTPAASTVTPKATRDVISYTIADPEGATASARIVLNTNTGSREYITRSLASDTAGEAPEVFNFLGVPADVRVKITAAGNLTGTARIAGRRFVLRGVIDPSAPYVFTAQTEFPILGEDGTTWENQLGILTLTVLDVSGTAPSVEVSAKFAPAGGDETSEEFALTELSEVSEAEGRYTLVLLAADPLANAVPEARPPTIESTSKAARRPLALAGHGTATMIVNATGSARIIGHLADGTAFSYGGSFADATTLPFYLLIPNPSHTLEDATLPLPRGYLAGEITLGAAGTEAEEGDSDADLTGTLRWTHTGVIADPFPRFGFASVVAVTGYDYVPKFGEKAPLDFPKSDRKRLVKCQLGATVGLDDVNVEGSGRPDSFFLPQLATFLDVDPDTGIVSGNVLHPVTQKRYQVSGVISQVRNQVLGQYKTRDGTGTLVIKPRNPPPVEEEEPEEDTIAE